MVIFLFLILFGFVKDNERIMVVVKLNAEAVDTLENGVDSLFKGKAVLRLSNISAEDGTAEEIYEISDQQLKAAEKVNGSCTKMLSSLAGVRSVSLVRQDDEINQ